ncbi:stage V sporulation protein M [Pseudanabaena sp. FACHB-2040]|nr:stage V sporulation protein M [Pseudanabaena sp. FACHB-2040]
MSFIKLQDFLGGGVRVLLGSSDCSFVKSLIFYVFPSLF